MHYRFEKILNSITYSFHFSAFCEEGCRYGGTCVAPNKCVCPSGFTGNHCEKGKVLLKLSFLVTRDKTCCIKKQLLSLVCCFQFILIDIFFSVKMCILILP